MPVHVERGVHLSDGEPPCGIACQEGLPATFPLRKMGEQNMQNIRIHGTISHGLSWAAVRAITNPGKEK